MYIITSHNICGITTDELNYLGWQNPAWDEDGYFWTSKENIIEMIREGRQNIGLPFLFNTEQEARAKARELKIRGFIILPWKN